VARSSTFAEECLERRYARHPARAPRLAGSALRVGASAAPAPGALVRRPVESPRGARRSQPACRARAGHVHAPGRRPAINKPAPPPTRRRPASRQWSAGAGSSATCSSPTSSTAAAVRGPCVGSRPPPPARPISRLLAKHDLAPRPPPPSRSLPPSPRDSSAMRSRAPGRPSLQARSSHHPIG
jgi:hypothetical protein